LDNKIDLIRQTSDNNFASERQNYNVNVMVLCTIVTFVLGMMALNWWYNFRIARGELQREFEKSRKKLTEEVSIITQKVNIDTDEKLDSLQKNYDRRFLLTNAYNDDAIGRIYKNESASTSSVWFMRAVDGYIKAGNNLDEWTLIRLEWVIECLKKPDSIGWPKDQKQEVEVILGRLPNRDSDEKIKEIADLMGKVQTF
jgi:hypothetical protein